MIASSTRVRRWAGTALTLAGGCALVIWFIWRRDPLSQDPQFAARLACFVLIGSTSAAAAAQTRRLWVSVLAAGAVVASAGALFNLRPNDDAYVFFRYAVNIVDGLGPVFNAGEWVEGYTSPLWLALLTGIARISGPGALPGASVVSGGALMCAALLGVGVLARQLGASWGASTVVVVAAAWFPVGFWGLSGMGTGLSTATSIWALAVAAPWIASPSRRRLRPATAGLLMALALLARPENLLLGAALGACIALLSLRERPSAFIWYGIPPAVLGGAHLVLSLIHI